MANTIDDVIGFRRAVLVLAIPLNLMLVAWMAIGRALFGIITAWMSYFMVIAAAPVLLVLLTLTTVLMFCQQRRPRLSTAQAWLQVACWLCMFVVGVAMEDGDDTGDVGGILLSLFGDNSTTETISGILLLIAGFGGAAAWLALFVLLIVGLTRRRPPARPTGWAFPPYPGIDPGISYQDGRRLFR
jgi:hypothetical protein